MFQTNILALNASVEAARVGFQGRGFAVAAGDVRTLAQCCAASAREILDLVVSSAQQVDAGGKKVDEAGQSMTEIVDGVRRVADLMAQIDAATREQSSGIESVNEAIARIDHATQANSTLQSHGRAALIADVNKLAQSRFVDRDLYLMMIRRDDSVFLAHGNNPRTLGMGPNSKDADGKRFVLTMTDWRAAKARDGWGPSGRTR